MDQKKWGPAAWVLIGSIVLNYPYEPTQEQKDRTKEFFYMLQHMLPCRYCRNNYRRNLKEFPIRLESRLELFKWMTDLHNEVNALCGKRSYSYQEALAHYENIYGRRFSLTPDQENRLQGERLKYSEWEIDWRFPLIIILTLVGIYLFY